jgi:hypothetical protein
LDQDQQEQYQGEAEEGTDQERSGDQDERDPELRPGVHPVDERPRVDKLPKDYVALQL